MIKHLSQMKPAQRAMADQSIRDALLAIVVAQGKPVVIPINQLDQISADHRLIIEVDHKANLVKLTAESHAAEIVKAAQPQVMLLDEASSIDRKTFGKPN